ncbi:hypothetical protein EE612_003795 [Oryza sativa]|nr:hypothetical protein EE612_003795 [Oryza sativa]
MLSSCLCFFFLTCVWSVADITIGVPSRDARSQIEDPRPDGWAVHQAGCRVRRGAAGLPQGPVRQARVAHRPPPRRLGRRHRQWPGRHRRKHSNSPAFSRMPSQSLCLPNVDIYRHPIRVAVCKVAEHYDSVVATDVSAERLRRAVPHPKVRYLHTPDAGADDDDLVAALGGEGCVDLITVAEAAHWFDLPAFYGAARRLLRKPGGVIAVWGYSYRVSPVEDMMSRFLHTTLPYWDSRARYVIDGYRDLPFPFDGVGLGKEGEPAGFDMEHEMAFPGLVRMLRSWSAVATARQRGVDLLDERVVRRLEEEWGGASLVRKVTFKAFLLAGTVRADDPA